MPDTSRRDIIHSARLGEFSASAARYTSSIDIDSRILEAVIDINIAHVIALSRQRIIQEPTTRKLLSALKSVPRDLRLNEFLEDVHMNVEDYVISRVGKEAGGMLNLGKSRNDQVATALRIALRKELLALSHGLIGLEDALLAKAVQSSSILMPGYTHLQRAQPITVGHHLLAHEEALERDLERLFQCYFRVNMCPMGAGALASSSVSLDRRALSSLLGFQGLVENSLDAVSARDFATEAIYVSCQLMNDLSKLAEEIVLWTSKEFSFATIPDKFASTSSMMPQKKNAVVPEIARARAAQVLGDFVGSMGIVKSLPLSYNLDLQELTRNLWSAVDKTRETLLLFSEMVADLRFNEKELREAVTNDETLYATEVADYLVTRLNLPFREAHGRVAGLVKHADLSGHLLNAFTASSEGDFASILGPGISKKEIVSLLDPNLVLARRKNIGSPNPKLVRQSCGTHARVLVRYAKKVAMLEKEITLAKENLGSQAIQISTKKQTP